MADLLEGRKTAIPMMDADDAREQAKPHNLLNDSQREAIDEVLNSNDRIHGLQALAETGRTAAVDFQQGSSKEQTR